jgi:hypothetical protein
MGRTLGPRWLASLALASTVMLIPAPAGAFGTVEGGGQNREHERITRAAVACRPGTGSDGGCFEPRSMDQLAGHGKTFGAVGSPDRTEVSDPTAHCDNADFLDGGYPQTRDAATAALRACVEHLRERFRMAVKNAGGLLDGDGRVAGAEVNLDVDCQLDPTVDQRAKCVVLEDFGRALHGVQDFYAHSNWADEADAARPAGADNPPGLNRSAPSPVLDLRGTDTPAVPRDLTTGCYVLKDRIPGVGACDGRVTHAALNKDNGLVDPVTGSVTAPSTPRGMVRSNFAKAVAGAVAETGHQWQEFQRALATAYGTRKASLITCVLTHDNPLEDCRALTPAVGGRIAGVDSTVFVLALSGVLLGVLGVILTIRARRRHLLSQVPHRR